MKSVNPKDSSSSEIILNNKFGRIFRQTINDLFFKTYDDFYSEQIGSALADVFFADANQSESQDSILVDIIAGIAAENKEQNCLAMLGMMAFAFNYNGDEELLVARNADFDHVFGAFLKFLEKRDEHYDFCICWTIVWSADLNIIQPGHLPELIAAILKIWINATKGQSNLKRLAAWALFKLLTPSIPQTSVEINALTQITQHNYSHPDNDYDKIVAIFLNILMGEITDKEKDLLFLKTEASRLASLKARNVSLFMQVIEKSL